MKIIKTTVLSTEKVKSTEKTKHRFITFLICVFEVLVILAGAAVGIFFAMKTAGRGSMENRRDEVAVNVTAPEETDTYVYDDYTLEPDCIRYKGKTYRYNESLTNFLFIGVDKDDLGYTEGVSGSGGQADVLYLFVLDADNGKVTILPIDRNTMTEVEAFNSPGESVGFSESQITFSYAYGDGKDGSCKLAENAVSDLLYGVPVHAYYSMSLGAIAAVNNAVGGVTVTIDEDMTTSSPKFVKGATVTLKDREAELYLRARKSIGDGSNESRIKRQKQYISSFISAAKSAFLKDLTLPITIFNKISKKSCTDLTANEIVYLASLAGSVDISFRNIKGKTEQNSTYDEFRADPIALFETVLDVFYICEDD